MRVRRGMTGENAAAIDAVRAWLHDLRLVPPPLAAYAPLVVDGLMYVLERLAPERLIAVVEEQAAFAADAAIDDRLIALLRRSPTLQKLGQVVARQPGLAPELRAHLQALESLPPRPVDDALRARIEREVGPFVGITIGDTTLAEGSVAVIVPFTWDAAPPGLPRRGVFKLLKPDAERDLVADLAVWPELGVYLEERIAHYGLPQLDVRGTLDGVAQLLRHEIDLARERERLIWARSFYADLPGVLIPQVLPLSTARITAMERIDGRKITDSGADAATRDRLARTLVEALLARPFWSPVRADIAFHADPHAGNLFATDDGRVAIFDWALTTQLTAEQVAAVVQVLLSAALLDEVAVARAIGVLGAVNDERALRDVVAASIGEIRRGTFPGFAWLNTLLDRVAREAVVTFPQATALFRKSLLTLAGVVADVSPAMSIDATMLRDGGRAWLADLPARALAPLGSRDFATHVSSADVLDLLTSAALVPTRIALGAYADWLRLLGA